MKRSRMARSSKPMSRGAPIARTVMPRGTKRLGPGKKTNEWATVRRELKVEFERLGVTRCQICLADNALGFAHCRKRRELLEGEIYHCALLCNRCHDELEIGDRDVMHDEVHRLRRRDGIE